jgi:hypothetical protein
MTAPVESFIDLDTVRDDAGARTSAGLSVGWRRALKAALVVVASLLTAGAVAPLPGPLQVVAVGERPVAGVALGDDAAFVAIDEAQGGSVIRRYRLGGDDGAVQWSVNLVDEVIAVRWVAAADVVVAQLDLERSGHGTVVLDAATGRVLWRAQATDVAPMAGTAALLVERRADGHPVRLRSVDLRSNAERWRRSVRADDILLLAPDPYTADVTRTIVIAATDGTVTVVDPDDGATAARRPIGARLVPSDRDYQRDFTEIAVVGDLFYVARRDQGTASIDAFHLATLAPAWSTRGEPVGRISDCGTLLCVNDDRAVTTLDPATATVRWASDRWIFLVPFGTERLLGYDSAQILSAVDATSGDLVAPLGTGVLLPGSPITYLRQDVGRGLTWVLEADRSGTRVSTLGSLPGVDAYGCHRRGRYIACTATDATAGVWRLPERP